MLNVTQFALLAVFASVALLTGAIASMVFARTTTERRRLRQVVDMPAKAMAVLPEILPLTGDAPEGIWDDLSKLLVLRSKKDISRLRTRMLRGGIRHPGAPLLYSAAEMVLPIVFGGAAYLVGLPAPPMLWLVVVAAAGLGFFLPGLWLERRLSYRRQQIESGLPDALDLLVVCIEAGSGIDQAILKTSDEIYFAYPALGDELRILNSEIRAGKTRIEAFKSLAARTKVDDVRALTANPDRSLRHEHRSSSAIACRHRSDEAASTGRGSRAEDWCQAGISAGPFLLSGFLRGRVGAGNHPIHSRVRVTQASIRRQPR
jgi:tight adherence protein C